MNVIRAILLPLNITLILALVLISGCATTKTKDLSKDPEAAYASAREKVHDEDYGIATKQLEKFTANFPYSKHAVPAQLLRIYAAYKGGEIVLSETLSRRFIDQHPQHKNVDYAEYILAMSYYKQRTSAERDITMHKSAIDAFERLIKEHPRSNYAADAQSHIQALYNVLAKHELMIGKFYFDHDRFVASANRFQELVRLYQTTPSIEEALYYLSASYAKMGLRRDARQTIAIIHHNYPDSAWSSKAKRLL